MRLNETDKVIKVCVVITLISNVFWGLLCILLVWRGIFGEQDASSTILKLYSSVSTVFATFICIDLLLLIWDAFYSLDLLVKFAFTELILVLLQFVVSKIFAA